MLAHNGSHSEKDRIQLSPILKFGVILIVVAILMHVVVWFLYQFLRTRTTRMEPPLTPLASRQHVKPPEPRLQVTPVEDLKALRKTEDEKLNTYGWVDPEKGIVRIPIARAMDLLVQKGNSK